MLFLCSWLAECSLGSELLRGRWDKNVVNIRQNEMWIATAQSRAFVRRPDGDVEIPVRRPDGDVELQEAGSGFVVPPCPRCGGILKPDVVFFGDGVPPERSAR